MAVPHRKYRSALPTEHARPARERSRKVRRWEGAVGRKAAGRRRRFAVLVVVPVLLMLGSVYLHTVAAGLDGRAAGLEENLDATRAEGERLDVRVAELSGAGRIRPLATEKLGMLEPGSEDLEVYERVGEDGQHNRGEQEGGRPR